MKTKNTNSLPAKVENIENQNQNTPAPAETPAPETPEQEQEQQEPAPVKVLEPKEWNVKLNEGWKDNPIDFVPSGLADIEGAQITMQRNLRLGAAKGDRTVYDCVIIVSGYQFTFVGGDSTQIKKYIKSTILAAGGDCNIQTGGKHTMVTKGCKSEEDVDAAVYAYKTDIHTAINKLEELLAKYNHTETGFYVALESRFVDDKGKHVTEYNGLVITPFLELCKAAKDKELEAHRAKLAEDERKQARKNLRDASDEEKDLAASVIGMDDWQKRMTAATAANDYAAIAALLAEKQNSETAA